MLTQSSSSHLSNGNDAQISPSSEEIRFTTTSTTIEPLSDDLLQRTSADSRPNSSTSTSLIHETANDSNLPVGTDNTEVGEESSFPKRYSNIPSALRPVPHNDTLPIPEPPNTYTLEPEIDLKDSEPQPGASNDTFNDDEEYSADLVSRQPHLLTQSELNDLVRDLQLPKTKSQLLGSRLQQWNLLEKGVQISSYRTRQATLKCLFSEDKFIDDRATDVM
ncbi:hypothetical protein RN001_004130 [Aquatica leii]|uniref:Uncharacterized protein n=1 Tax=Aquatica leii TaxID=1421715 RepID=A0AAN7PJB1_9COLE|nr:hypothetical protein RN001_004130 [Aquatica leii]